MPDDRWLNDLVHHTYIALHGIGESEAKAAVMLTTTIWSHTASIDENARSLYRWRLQRPLSVVGNSAKTLEEPARGVVAQCKLNSATMTT